jgi:Cft2 family RNA processing exonuclease
VGGLSTKLTEVHDRLASASRRQFPGLELSEAVAPFTLGGRDLNRLEIRPGRIYALSSGMMTENTLSNLVAPQFLPNPDHAIFFIGYADPESPAGRLRAAKPGTSFMVSPSIEPETIRCQVETFGFSAHASRESLLDFLQATPAAKTVFVHGDPEAQLWMRENARTRLPNTQFPEALPGQPLEL